MRFRFGAMQPPNKPLERAGMNPLRRSQRGGAGRLAPNR
jgi:hypothetical protein